MTKTDLIKIVATTAGIKNETARVAIDATFKAISDTLVSEGLHRVVGFGTFDVKERQARTGRNPQTGEPIQIPASKVVKFRASKELKESVNS